MQESTAEPSSSLTPSHYGEDRGGAPDNDIADKLPHEFPGGILPVGAGLVAGEFQLSTFHFPLSR